jgi:uncharacterized membrane protein
MRVKRLCAVVATVVTTGLLAVPCTPASAVSTSNKVMVPLQVPPGVSHVAARAINNTGQVVGAIDTRAVAWDAAGRVRVLPLYPGYQRSSAYAINDAGVIVGYVTDNDMLRVHAARWDPNGTVPTLLAPDEKYTNATAISNRGEAVGVVSGTETGKPVRFRSGRAVGIGSDTSAFVRGVADDNGATITGTYTPNFGCPACIQRAFQHRLGGGSGDHILPPSPSEASQAEDIDDSGGRIAGTVSDHATVWELRHVPGPFPVTLWRRTTLGQVEPGAPTRVSAMSRNGDILVGTATGDGAQRAFVHQNGAFTFLPNQDSLGIDVNDSGVVLGMVRIPGFEVQTPVLWR